VTPQVSMGGCNNTYRPKSALETGMHLGFVKAHHKTLPLEV